MQDYDEFVRKQGQKDKPSQPNRESQLAAFLQAGVSAEYLTTDPNWDKFLGYVEAALLRATEHRDSMVERLSGPDVVVAEDFHRVKHQLDRANGMISALEWARELPKSLIAGAEAARELLPEARKEGDAS